MLQEWLDTTPEYFRAWIMSSVALRARTLMWSGSMIIFRFIITPLFLFSGTFFPISQLPPAVQPIAWLTPLFHGVALTRALALGEPLELWQWAVHVGYLVALVTIGTLLALRTFRRRLVI